MKPKSTLRNLLALAGSSLLAVSSASAAPYTWTQTTVGNQDWTTAGNWDASTVFVSGSGNELIFFADTSTQLNPTVGTLTITNVPTLLSMNTLTLNGKGPNGAFVSYVIVGDNTSTWTIGDGTTSMVNLNSTMGGGHAGLDDLRYTIAAHLTLNGGTGNITTFTGNSTSAGGATFSGDITGAGQGITKSGSSVLVLSGNNTYTGTTLVTGGVLRLASANALSGGTGATGGTSALTLNGGVVELAAGNFSRALGTGSSQFQITGGTSGFSSSGGPSVITVNGNASQEVVWGSSSFNASTFVLNSSVALNSLTFANKIDLNGATRTVQVNADKAVISGDIRTSSGTAGLTKTGNGTLVLTGNNTYDGDTTVSGGAISFGTDSNFNSASSGIILNTATLQITGTTLTSLSSLGPAVTFNSGNKGFDIQDANNTFTVDQVLSHSGTLSKSGVGTLVLNQDNTFNNATTASGGGTLVLDYTTNNGSKLTDASKLTLAGSNLVLKGGSHTEVVGSTDLGINNSGFFTNVGNSISRDGGTSTISLGALTIRNFSTLAISEANIATTTTGNTNGILSLGRVTVGSHFGANDGSNNIVAYSGYTAATTAGGGNTSTVNQLTGGGTMAANLSSYSLRIANSGNSDVLDLGSSDLILVNNGTLLYAGGSDNSYTINGSGNLKSASNNQPFIINTSAGTTLTVNAQIGENFGGVAKGGTGTLVVGAANTKLAITKYIQQGVLRLTNGDGLGTDYTKAQAVSVQGGAALELSNNIDVGAQTLDLNGVGISNGGALRNLSGTNSFAGAITTGLSGARINSDAGSLTLTGGIATTAIQDATFGGAGDTTVSTTAISGSGGAIKDGAGTLTLSSTNTYTGATTINGGTLAITGATQGTSAISFTGGSLGLDTGSPVTASSAAVDLTNGTIKVTGSTGASSYTLLTAASITGTPVLASPVSGYELQIAAGSTQLRLVQTGAANPYDAWATGGELFDGDANGDGVSNGLAFLLGATGPNVSALGLLPTVTETAGGLVMTFSMLDAASRSTASLSVEHSSDLGISDAWTTVLVPEANGGPTSGVTFTVSENAGDTDLNDVVATISSSEAAAGKIFGRLKAVNP